MTTKDLKAPLDLANVCVQEAKALNKQDVDGRTPQRKLLIPEKNIAAHVKFVKDHTDTVNCLGGTFSTTSGIKRALDHHKHIVKYD